MNPDRWLVLTARVPADRHAVGLDSEEAIIETLIALGGAAVQEDEGEYTTYVLPPPDLEGFIHEARDRLESAVGDVEVDVSWHWQENEDWAEGWRNGLRPRRVGERIIVAPTWTKPETREGDEVLWIDPQMAFGTGEHATTRGVLRLLERVIEPDDRVLDVGTGSGVLAIAAARLGASGVVAVESDEDALINARENVERNEVAARIALVHGLVDDAYLDRYPRGSLDLIVANVLSGVLVPLLPAFFRALRPAREASSSSGHKRSGRLILGGILEVEAPEVASAARDAGLRLIAEDEEEGWWSALFTR